MAKIEQFADYTFELGLNTDISEIQVSKRELVEADNVDIMGRGGVRKRFGTEPVNTSSYGAEVHQLIEFPRNSGDIDLLAVLGTNLVNINPDGTTTIIQSLNSERIAYFFLQDKFYFIDPGTEYYMYDGAVVEPVPNENLGTKVTAIEKEVNKVFDGEGNVIGYGFFIDGDLENLPITEGTEVIYDSNNEYVKGTDYTIDYSNGLVKSIDGGSFPQDGYVKVDYYYGEGGLEKIRRCKYAHYHSESNRIFFAGDSQNASALYYSEYNEPGYVKGTSVVHPTRAEGRIKGLSVLMDAIIVSYSHGNYIWRGIDPSEDAIWERLPTSHGAINDDAFALTTSSLSMVSDDGIFALTPNIMGISMENEAGQGYIMNMTKDRVGKIINSITNKENVRSVFYPKESKLFVAFSDQTSGVNNKILILDFQTKSFSLYTDIQINDFCLLKNGDLYGASDNYIVKFSDDIVEDIQPNGTTSVIDFKMKTPKYGFGNPFVRKKIIKMFIIFKNFGSVHELKVNLYADSEKVQEEIINGDDSGTEIITERIKTYHSGNNFQVEIINDQYSEVEIYGIGFFYTIADTGGNKANE